TPETFVEELERYMAMPEHVRQEPKPSAAPTAYVRPPATKRKNVRILIADNEPANIEVLRLLLDHWGYDVLAAPSGRAALELARRERPDVIISDLHMPDGDGLELLETARADPRLRETPIIFVSATNPRPRAIEKAA